MRIIFAMVCFHIVFLACCVLGAVNSSSRILGIFPTPSISHQLVFCSLMENLAKRGHHVVTMTPNPKIYKEKIPTLTKIDVEEISYTEWNKKFDFIKIHESDTTPTELIRLFYTVMSSIIEMQMNTPAMQKLLNDPSERFDLCFFEALAPHINPIKDRFNCSLILISSLSGSLQDFDSFGNPSNPVLYPDFTALYLGDLDFWQRLHLTYLDIRYRFMYYFQLVPLLDNNAKKMFGESVRSVDKIQKEADMLFLNVHPLLGGIRPTVPGIVYMGSMHIRPIKPLPSDLQKILDDAKNGVVYLSLGSNVKSAQLSQVKINAFLEAFKELPYTVLWKWENETLPGKPANVHISKWLPQQDVLAHPNIKAFITQGGQQSMEEAIHHKVPLIGMPFLGDQDLNVRKMVKFGIGTDMNLYTLSKEIIVNSIKKVVEDPSYRENISKLSNLLTDQPQTSMERAVWWTEYVLRHKGAKHLRAPGTKVPAYQYFLLDIIAFVLVCAVVAIYIIVKISCEIHKRFIRKPDKPKKS
ncbi:UDP-glycosyltransferase UGT5-like isoform X1 [Arctopsyche grandis]|uniref:UDP-glycosyltransferase UGT5-like isoform X1 n=1 Tax=Arctopsyche grandis TaxID=121162 RepID=UPI00406D88CD